MKMLCKVIDMFYYLKSDFCLLTWIYKIIWFRLNTSTASGRLYCFHNLPLRKINVMIADVYNQTTVITKQIPGYVFKTIVKDDILWLCEQIVWQHDHSKLYFITICMYNLLWINYVIKCYSQYVGTA